MNPIEKKVYNIIKKNTRVKNCIRNLYQGFFSIMPKKKKVSNYEIIEREGFFYGFHDKIPWSFDNSLLLTHKFTPGDRFGDAVEIGYFYGEGFRVYKKITSTKSWNWQQGAMLQWLNDSQMIFNDWNGEKNIARVFDMTGKKVKDLSHPIGAVSPDGQWALTYSFERLNTGMPGYGYFNENDSSKHEPIPNNSGLSLIDLCSGEKKCLFSIKDIVNIAATKSMKDAYHFFTHCLFSPNSKRFLFLHRWYKEGKQLHSRMISCDLSGNNIYIFPTGEMVSHITWVSDIEVMAYCNTETDGDGYHIFNISNSNFRKVAEKHYTSDGHPQYSRVNGKIITDTYPNRYRIQELSIYNILEDDKEVIAKLWSPNSFRDEMRCDLHPRWDRLGNQICFDSAHTGVRSLCTINLSKL